MIWCESPTNPTMKVTDLRAVATTIKESKQEIIFVVDNTFMTPYFQVCVVQTITYICKRSLQNKITKRNFLISVLLLIVY